MDKSELISKIKNKNYTQDQLLGWIGALPGGTATRKPIKVKRGDVFMHPVFQHPYIFLEKKNGFWLCGLITSEPTCTEILEPCKSRFFSTNYITRVFFTQTTAVGSFINIYDNPKHLKEVTAKLKSIIS